MASNRRMNAQMNQMLSSMKTSMSSMMSKDPFQDMPTLGAGSSGGKMYIMESGPGYHEEKSYDIGPNGKMTLIDNDMSKLDVAKFQIQGIFAQFEEYFFSLIFS